MTLLRDASLAGSVLISWHCRLLNTRLHDCVLWCSEDGQEAYFPKKLLDLTMRIQRQSTHLEFPQMPFAYAQCTNPALQFANSICHVLSLDQLIEHEVHLLKRVTLLIATCCIRLKGIHNFISDLCMSCAGHLQTLLRAIRVPEFTRESKFAQPSPIFILPGVMCNRCGAAKVGDCWSSCRFGLAVTSQTGRILLSSRVSF